MIPNNSKKKKGKRPASKGVSLQKTGRSKYVTAPVTRGTTRVGGYGLSFGPAPYEETLGEGLRMHATMMTGPIHREANSGGSVTKVFTGYDSSTTSVSTSNLWTSLRSNATWGAYPLFDNSNTYSTPLHTFISLFSKMSVRKMKITYVPLVSTAIGGALAIGASFENGYHIEETNMQSVASLNKSFVTPLWKAASFMAINDRDMSKPAMRLYDTETKGDETAPVFQASLIGAVDSLPTDADTIGHLELELVIDVYQFKYNQINIAAEQKEVRVEKPTCTMLDEGYVKLDQPSGSASSSSVTTRTVDSCVSQPLSKMGKAARAQ